MDPITVVEKGVGLSQQYGLAVVLAIAVIVILAWVIWYGFTQNAKREKDASDKADLREKRMGDEARAREDRLVEIIKGQSHVLKEQTTAINNLNSRIESAQGEHQNRHQFLITAAQHCREENASISKKLERVHEDVIDRNCKAKP